MYDPDPMRGLAAAGVSRAIDVLEVCSSIMFSKGIKTCLTYIEAVPWNENEEEKLKNLFARFTFDEAISQDILARLRPHNWKSSDDLAVQLIQSVTNSTSTMARKDMQSLVNGLLSKSSVYQKDSSGLNKESLYQICYSCLESLVDLFEEAIEPTYYTGQAVVVRGSKPLIERISTQTENLNWLLDILVNIDIAEEFVELWAKQGRLIRMHEQASAIVRYELSRISAGVFIALGKGKVQCRGDVRSLLFHGWFSTMLLDFGWLQRCPKGLDLRSLEENLGRGLLTLPLRQQQCLFEEWFQFYATKGPECPNLIRAFQVWWRRSFIRSLVEPQN
ncbi:BTB/POZ domain-containing protein [Zea mays]|nr:BTB/POZ domain-containing protein [Zea mays]ONM52741.1 BTB/POZ domain-containing protein [Zea mays]